MPPATSLFGAMRDFVAAFVRHAGRQGWAAAVLVAAGAVLEGLGLLLLVPIVGVVLEGSGGAWLLPWFERLGAGTRGERLAILLAGFVVVMMLRAVVLYARDMLLAQLQTGFIHAERNHVMQVVTSAPWSRLATLEHSRITNLMGAELQRISAAMQFAVQGSVALGMLAIQTALAVALSLPLAGLSAILLLLGAGLWFGTQGRVRLLGADVVEASRALIGSTSAFLSGLKGAAAQGAQASFADEFAVSQARLREGQLDFFRRQARSRMIFGLVSAVLGVVVVAAGHLWLALPPALLITLIVIFARMSVPALTVLQSAQQLVYALPSFEAVRSIERDLLDRNSATPVAVAPPPGAIELRDASYRHAAGGGISHVDLRLAAGSFTGVTGPSGGGKTTLIDLLAGLIEPQSGSLLVGGERLDAARLAGWRASLAYVPQDGFLFHDTVRRNLAWGNPPLDDPALAEALALTGADRVIAALPQGLETVIGERGGRLSGGERQRIAIARALLRRPRLLTLDEATNALDTESEAVLLDCLATLDPRPTIVLISHRPASLHRCDRIVQVEAGRVVGDEPTTREPARATSR